MKREKTQAHKNVYNAFNASLQHVNAVDMLVILHLASV